MSAQHLPGRQRLVAEHCAEFLGSTPGVTVTQSMNGHLATRLSKNGPIRACDHERIVVTCDALVRIRLCRHVRVVDRRIVSFFTLLVLVSKPCLRNRQRTHVADARIRIQIAHVCGEERLLRPGILKYRRTIRQPF